MSEIESHGNDEVSLFELGATLILNRWRIAKWAVAGAVVAALTTISIPVLYRGSASFVPQGSESGRTGVAGLASQLGVSLPGSNPTLSGDFYVSLLRSREVLNTVVRDTFTVPELGGKRVTFYDLFEIGEGSPALREELGAELLSGLVDAAADKKTGTVRVDVRTKWPTVSLVIVRGMIAGVNGYNDRTRQVAAATERTFLERRLQMVGDDLRIAEDRLQRFLAENRQYASSPQLVFANERLKRSLGVQQQVFLQLTQAYEDARIREVRDTPVITLVNSPSVGARPEPRGRVVRVVLGIVFGAFVGLIVVFAGVVLEGVRDGTHPDGERFLLALTEVANEVRGLLSRIRRIFRRA